jgi:hypothetical protein
MIFEHANDLHVVARLVYVKTNDAYAYSDSAKTAKIDAETLKDMFIKGVLIVDGDNLYKPVSLEIDEGVATITYVQTDGTVATTAVLATLVSKEYVPDP